MLLELLLVGLLHRILITTVGNIGLDTLLHHLRLLKLVVKDVETGCITARVVRDVVVVVVVQVVLVLTTFTVFDSPFLAFH